jgi:hypothetical protein
MANQKNSKSRNSSARKDKRLVARLYAKHRREFTAADLQRYTIIEDGIPLDQVIGECTRIHRKSRPKS